MALAFVDTAGLKQHTYRGISRYVEGLLGGFDAIQALGGQVTTDPIAGRLAPIHHDVVAPLPVNASDMQHRIVTLYDFTPIRYPMQVMRPWQLAAFMALARDLRETRRAPNFVAISNATARDATRYLKVNPSQIDVIYPGVSEGFLSSGPRKPNAVRPFVLYVGAASRHKNLPRLLTAHSRVKNDRTELVLAGLMTARQRARLSKLAVDLGTKQRVHFKGPVSEIDLIELYRTASLVAQVSLWEGFGMPILEAMAVGCPVVCSGTSSMPEVVGPTGLMVSPRNVDEIVAAIDNVLNDRASAEARADEARLRAQGFTWSAAAEMHLAMYDRLADS